MGSRQAGRSVIVRRVWWFFSPDVPEDSGRRWGWRIEEVLVSSSLWFVGKGMERLEGRREARTRKRRNASKTILVEYASRMRTGGAYFWGASSGNNNNNSIAVALLETLGNDAGTSR